MDPTDRRQLVDLLASSFTIASLRAHVRSLIGTEVHLLAIGGDIHRAADETLMQAERHGWSVRFMRSLSHTIDLDREARALLTRLGALDTALQSFLDAVDPMMSAPVVGEAVIDAESRVFSLELEGRHRGTGFLVGPDLALTNHHVLESLFTPEGLPRSDPDGRVAARFDFGRTVSEGRRFGLAAEWHLASSRAHALDDVAGVHDCTDFVDTLDFVLFRLDRPIGLSMSPHREGRRQRGWYHLAEARDELRADRRLIVFAHPRGRPLSLDQGRVSWVNENRTRVRYTLNTAHGASGAPCFDNEMTLAAIHHSGDPDERRQGHRPEYSQGIPIGRVVAKLRALGLEDLLVRPPRTDEVVLSVGRGEPVLDRLPLQDVVRRMARGQGSRVLLIDGPPHSGRQFTRMIVQCLAERYDQPCVPIPLEAHVDSTPGELCTVLSLELNLNASGIPPRPEDRQSTRWSTLLTSWLCGQLRSRFSGDAPVWLVFDCVGGLSVPPDLRDFLVAVAVRAFDLPGLRMVVIGGDNLFPPHVRQRAEEQLTTPVAPVDVSRYLQEMASRNLVELDRDAADDLADLIFSALPEDAELRWSGLVADVELLATRLSEVTDAN